MKASERPIRVLISFNDVRAAIAWRNKREADMDMEDVDQWTFRRPQDAVVFLGHEVPEDAPSGGGPVTILTSKSMAGSGA